MFIGGYRGDLLAIDGATGKTRWKRATGSQIRADVAIGADGTIYFSSEAPPDRAVSALDPATGAVRWSFSVARYSIGSSVVVDAEGVLYFGTGSGIRLYALDGRSGTERFNAQIETSFEVGPILGDERVLYEFAADTLTAISP